MEIHQSSFLSLLPINMLDLGLLRERCLRSAGIVFLSDLVKKTEDELLEILNYDLKSLAYLKGRLANNGLALRKVDKNSDDVDIDGQNSIMLQNLDKFNFSVRAQNCFKKENIVYLADLVRKTEEDLFRIRNFGKKCYYEIQDKLEEMGLSLGMDIDREEPALQININTSQGNQKRTEEALLTVKDGDERFAKLFISVDELDFSTRSINLFKQKKIVYIGDLVQKSKKDLIDINLFGKKCFSEVLLRLDELGLSLGMSIPEWELLRKDDERKRRKDEVRKSLIENSNPIRTFIDNKTITLEDEINYIAALTGDGRNKEIIIKFYGWDGQGCKTLESVAAEFKITRERVRQICSIFEKKLSRSQYKFACLLNLDAAIKIIEENTPNTIEEIEGLLVNEGIIKNQFNIEGIISVSRLLKRENDLSIFKIKKQRYIVKKAISEKNIKSIIYFAKKAISRNGVSNIEDIAAQVNELTDQIIDSKLIISTMSIIKGFSWLHRESGWFWISTLPRNRLINQMRKILSLNDKIEISQMRSGIGRFQRMRGFSPPRHVLLELCKQIPWCRVEDNFVKADPPLNWEEILDGTTELIMAKILKKHDSVMLLDQFEKECLKLGMNRHTFIAYLHSPIITRHTIGVYGLRGAKVNPGLIKDLADNYKAQKVVNDYGWTDDGRIWLAIQLNPGMLRSGLFYIPGSIHNYLQGDFKLVDAEDIFINNIKIRNHGAWCLSPFFSRRGGDVGDYMVLIFDLASHNIMAYIGDRDLLEDFQQK